MFIKSEKDFINGEIYHLYNRGVEKRKIFVDENDKFRFVFSLYECNDQNPVIMRDRIFKRKERNLKLRPIIKKVSISPTSGRLKRERLVDILVFCLMPNHYHLVVKQLVDGGISRFMIKLGDSYVKYFNDRHKRTGLGSLFQGKFKSKIIESNDQLLSLVTYVHLNPIGIVENNWKEEGIKDTDVAKEFLENYRWSSYFDYFGKTNFPSVIQKDTILKVFAGAGANFENTGMENIKSFANGWIVHKSELAKGISWAI